MAELTRKAAMGIPPPNEEIAAISNLIDVQLQSAPSSSERVQLLDTQRHVRSIASRGSVAHMPPPLSSAALNSTPALANPPLPAHPLPTPPIGYIAPAPQPVVPPVDSNALNNLMRSLPHAPLTSLSTSIAGHPSHPQAFKSHSPQPLKYSDIKSTSHAAAVRALYTELPHLSKSDGMRFATTEALRQHLDWLFAQNRRKRARERNLSSAGMSRCWYDRVEAFFGIEESRNAASAGEHAATDAASREQAAQSSKSTTGLGSRDNTDQPGSVKDQSSPRGDAVGNCVESRDVKEVCPACCEGFQSFWDDGKQAWMLRDAIRADDGQVFHTRCASSMDESATNETGSRPERADKGDGEGIQEKLISHKREAPDARTVGRQEEIVAEEHPAKRAKVNEIEAETVRPTAVDNAGRVTADSAQLQSSLSSGQGASVANSQTLIETNRGTPSAAALEQAQVSSQAPSRSVESNATQTTSCAAPEEKQTERVESDYTKNSS